MPLPRSSPSSRCEILVDEVQFPRQADREGRFDDILKTLTERAVEQRKAGND